MYKIIGADGKEYGPITANQLRQWVAQGRVNAASKVQPDGSPDWLTLGSLPEFADALAQPPAFPNLPTPPAVPAKTSGMAIASLVLGLIGIFCGVTAIVGLVLGIVGLAKINKSQGQLTGKGLAIAGIIVSSLMLVFSLLILPALLLPALSKAQHKAQAINCINNVKQIGLAMILYADSNTNLPPAATWCDAIQSDLVSTRPLLCPKADASQRCHYAFNANLDGLNLEKVSDPARTVLVFETDGGWNLSGGSELLPAKPRHDGTVVVGFADGHVERLKTSQLDQLKWEP